MNRIDGCVEFRVGGRHPYLFKSATSGVESFSELGLVFIDLLERFLTASIAFLAKAQSFTASAVNDEW